MRGKLFHPVVYVDTLKFARYVVSSGQGNDPTLSKLGGNVSLFNFQTHLSSAECVSSGQIRTVFLLLGFLKTAKMLQMMCPLSDSKWE